MSSTTTTTTTTFNNTSSGTNQNRTVFNVVGQRGIPGINSYAITTGSAKYTRDMVLPNMLFGKALRSPYARATITSMDTTAAAALPGVRAIIRYDDPDIKALPTLNNVAMMTEGTIYPLPADAYFEGEEVGCVVAADSEEICDQALALIMANTKWNVLPFVLDTKATNAPGAPVLNPDLNPKSNQYSEAFQNLGNATTALASSDYVIEYTQSYPPVPYHISEPASSFSYWDTDESGNSILHVGDMSFEQNMGPWYANMIAYNLPAYRVQPMTQFAGPQYCSFITGVRYYVLGPLLAKRTGRPVRMAESRREAFQVTGSGAAYDIKIGFNKDGTLQAASGEMLFNIGARGGSATAYNMNSFQYYWMGPVGNQTPNIYGHIVANWSAISRMRNGLCTASQMVHAQAFYRMAEKLGRDPIDLNLQNFNTPNSSLLQCVQNGKKAINWQWHPAGTKKLPDGRMHGYGFRIKDVAVSGGITYNINLEIKPDGKVYMPYNEGYQGTFWMDCDRMVIAEEMGAKIDDVIVYYSPNDQEWFQGTARDRGAGSSWACKEAAVQLKATLLKVAAASGAFGTGVTAAQLDTQNSTVYLKSDPTKTFPFAKFGNAGSNTLTADFIGHCDKPNTSLAPGTFPTMNAIFCEVAVDTATGQVEILNWVAACDAGKMIRPSSFEGQMEQPCINMTGTALREEMIRDPATGVLLNGSTLMLMPSTILDIAPIAMPNVESRMGTGCYGGVAQAHQIYDRVTVPLAVYNAIGKWIDPPITPDKVLAALGQIPVSSVRTTGGIET